MNQILPIQATRLRAAASGTGKKATVVMVMGMSKCEEKVSQGAYQRVERKVRVLKVALLRCGLEANREGQLTQDMTVTRLFKWCRIYINTCIMLDLNRMSLNSTSKGVEAPEPRVEAPE